MNRPGHDIFFPNSINTSRNNGMHIFSRRHFLVGAGIAASGFGLYASKYIPHFGETVDKPSVFIGNVGLYNDTVTDVLRDGLNAIGRGREWIKGKRVLLKPNLVEPSSEHPYINTHPVVVRAVADIFLRWDAEEVLVGEGSGHCRDSELVLYQSGMADVIKEVGITYVDLNCDDVFTLPNPFKLSGISVFHLPVTLQRVDVIVSLAKMKTHHWVGATLSMKNLFGVLPGIVYGWPKNSLHIAGIHESIVDLTAVVRPHLAIIDGIVAMEGDGPIMGSPRNLGAIVMGTAFPSVDATAARLMGFDPHHIRYLSASAQYLGPIDETSITQRGEQVDNLSQSFNVLNVPWLQNIQRRNVKT